MDPLEKFLGSQALRFPPQLSDPGTLLLCAAGLELAFKMLRKSWGSTEITAASFLDQGDADGLIRQVLTDVSQVK